MPTLFSLPPTSTFPLKDWTAFVVLGLSNKAAWLPVGLLLGLVCFSDMAGNLVLLVFCFCSSGRRFLPMLQLEELDCMDLNNCQMDAIWSMQERRDLHLRHYN